MRIVRDPDHSDGAPTTDGTGTRVKEVAVAEGLAADEARIGTFRDRPLRPWIDRWGAYWGWLHPRYR
jgi:hypothetical protein